ncbi:MAG: CPBP family intramembrane metalloprotease [Candidatus Obscuribacterales bacterium]|nr:CPBP family intramembrane metalloprotease [Candidatus Obscuribacterales bacterium]
MNTADLKQPIILPWRFYSALVIWLVAWLIAIWGQAPLAAFVFGLLPTAFVVSTAVTLSMTAAVLFLALAFRWRGLSLLKEIRCSFSGLSKGSLWFCVVLSLLYAVVCAWHWLCPPATLQTNLAAGDLQGKASWINILAVVIVGPILEEILFRGFLFNLLNQGFSKYRWLAGNKAAWLAVVLTALVFAASHESDWNLVIRHLTTGGLCAWI